MNKTASLVGVASGVLLLTGCDAFFPQDDTVPKLVEAIDKLVARGVMTPEQGAAAKEEAAKTVETGVGWIELAGAVVAGSIGAFFGVNKWRDLARAIRGEPTGRPGTK